MNERNSDEGVSPEVARLIAKREFKIRMESEDDGTTIYTSTKKNDDDGYLPDVRRNGPLR